MEHIQVTAENVWDRKYDVRLTSLWSWMPSSWAAIGWSNDSGEKKRDNLLKKLSNPFIMVCYITKNASKNDMNTDPAFDGKLMGFYLVSHERGHRNDFTAPIHHSRAPGKWIHAVRAIQAFSLHPDFQIQADSFYPGLSKKYARIVASYSREIEPELVDQLSKMQFIEEDIFNPESENKYN